MALLKLKTGDTGGGREALQSYLENAPENDKNREGVVSMLARMAITEKVSTPDTQQRNEN
jgi:hypothetical protein